MKKTIDISLAGILFHVEEDAYEKLKKYLKSVRQSLTGTEDTDEVMHEIEARIAELLLQIQNHPQQVINTQNIDEIISVMGQPEDFEVAETEHKSYQKKIKKALFRDMDKSVLGGIAAGLAHYVGIDISIMRLLFVVLLFVTHGSFILIYLLLWIIIPKAKTASDKLKMKGENINVDNIVEQISTEEEQTKKKVKIGETVEQTTGEAGKIVLKILGLFIVLIAGSMLLGLIVSVLGLGPFFGINLVLENNLRTTDIGISMVWLNMLLGITLGFPAVLLFLLGIKMIVPNAKSINKNVFLIGGTLWLISIAYFVSQKTPYTYLNNRHIQSVKEKTAWSNNKDTLLIETAKFIPDAINNRITDNRIYYKIHPSSDSLFHIEIEKTAEGNSRRQARTNALKIDYIYKNDSFNNRFVFARKMSYPNNNGINDRKIFIHIYLPENKYVKLDTMAAYHSKSSPCLYPELLKNTNQKIHCISHFEIKTTNSEVIKITGKNIQIEADKNAVNINANDKNNEQAQVQIKSDGIKIEAHDKNGKTAEIQINKKGIKIKTNNDEK